MCDFADASSSEDAAVDHVDAGSLLRNCLLVTRCFPRRKRPRMSPSVDDFGDFVCQIPVFGQLLPVVEARFVFFRFDVEASMPQTD